MKAENFKGRSKKKPVAYKTEKRLVNEFVGSLARCLKTWGKLRVTREFDYQSGRTDIVAVTTGHELLAFEAKLTDWRTALNQAYRNTCFANFSYVLVPESTSVRASCYFSEFSRRGVGLCIIHKGRISVLIEARSVTPIQPWLSQRALEQLSGENRRCQRKRV